MCTWRKEHYCLLLWSTKFLLSFKIFHFLCGNIRQHTLILLEDNIEIFYLFFTSTKKSSSSFINLCLCLFNIFSQIHISFFNSSKKQVWINISTFTLIHITITLWMTSVLRFNSVGVFVILCDQTFGHKRKKRSSTCVPFNFTCLRCV